MPAFVPRQRKHKVLARQNQKSARPVDDNQNTNQEILLPTSQAQKEVHRQQLREELRAQHTKVSSKKQKRFEKYIDTKLRKDETADYIRRLEQEREKFDVSNVEGFKSIKRLNQDRNGKKRAWKDYVSGQLNNTNLETGNNGKGDHKIAGGSDMKNVEDDSVSVDSFEAEHEDAFQVTEPVQEQSDSDWLARKAPPVQGLGLAKPLEIGPDGLPVIPTKRKKATPLKQDADKQMISNSAIPQVSSHGDDEEVPWEGFSSDSEQADRNQFSDHESQTEDSDSELDSDVGSESEDMESDSDMSISSAGGETKIRTRSSAFKSWATQQLNQAIGHTPSYLPDGDGILKPAPSKPDQPTTTSSEKVVPQLLNGLPIVKESSASRIVHNVQVGRLAEVQEIRSQLPVIQCEQEIMEAIHNNPIVVIKGETGSGKTTQIPQFLYEAGYGDPNGPMPGLIGVTQPRRVAAVSMAKRVGEELGSHGDKVSHQIRFDSTVSSKTAIKFMTDGILLRELSQDLLLKKYSAIIIDEAHERSINTDILIGMLSKIVPARMRRDKFNPDPKPLKLIIMSATLNITDFLHDGLFSGSLSPPIVTAEGRQHKVTTHFARRSRADYLDEVVEKVRRAHHKLPKGGILVFLTGQNEIREAQTQLRNILTSSSDRGLIKDKLPRMHIAASEIPLEVDDLDLSTQLHATRLDEDDEDEIKILTNSDEEEDDDEFVISDDENDDGDDNDNSNSSSMRSSRQNATTTGNISNDQRRLSNKDPYDSVHILPLYSQLPTKEQLRVFESPPERSRLIVLATNVAETSLTIPGIRFVFDCGRSKERKYDLTTGVQSFEIDYISKASAQQRAGRAGRTGPGHCWRLYSSAVYERFFPDHTAPEVLRVPAESIVLQIKGFSYPHPVSKFPFPTPPALETLIKAENLLRNLGALDTTGKLTELGKQLAIYPLSPRLGKILSVAVSNSSILGQMIALVSGLAVSEVFITEAMATGRHVDESSEDEYQQDQKQSYGRAQATLTRHDKSSDVMKLLTAILKYIDATDKEVFCKEYFLRPKAMAEVAQLFQQLKHIVHANHAELKINNTIKDLQKWTTAQMQQISMFAAAGYIDQIAVRWDCAPNPPTLPSKPRRAVDVPYLPLIPLTARSSSELHDRAVFIHPSSVLARKSAKDVPQYIIYTHLQQAQSRTIGAEQMPKTRMFPLTPIDEASLGQLARDTALIEYGKPIAKAKVEDLPGTPKRRICWVSTELRGSGAGSYGWNLPPTKVKQVIDVKSSGGWRVEEVIV